MDLKRLKNINDFFQRMVDEGETSGAAGMITRHNAEVYCSSFGMRDLSIKAPLNNDDIYRIYSMTKTITVVAAMTLYEKGLFILRQPVSDFIPAFRDVKVAEYDERGVVRIVPAKTPVTFEHLFNMTSGISYPREYSVLVRTTVENDKKYVSDAKKTIPLNGEQTVNNWAKLPFQFHPGEHWMYAGTAHDTLGRLIEIISGKSLGEYFSEVIFKPLEMKDSAFFVPKEKQKRVVKPYHSGSNGLEEINDLVRDPASPNPPAFERGGSGLCSTMIDYSRFAQMILNNGKSGKERILSRKTVELIRTKNCVPSELASAVSTGLAGYGWGLGVRTMLDISAAGLNGSFGEWGWGGAMNTYYFVDPAEDMTALFFTQLTSDNAGSASRRFFQMVYSAIND